MRKERRIRLGGGGEVACSARSRRRARAAPAEGWHSADDTSEHVSGRHVAAYKDYLLILPIYLAQRRGASGLILQGSSWREGSGP